MAARTRRRWSASTCAYRSRSALTSRVEPSMSLNRKVTAPLGRPVMAPAIGMGAWAAGVASLPTADPATGGSSATYESVLAAGDGVDTANRSASAVGFGGTNHGPFG